MMKTTKKLNKCSELMWLMGIILVSLGVAMVKKADLGVSMIAAPAFIIYEAVAHLWNGFSVGMVEYLVQGILMVVLCIVVQRFNWRYLLAFAVAVIYGYALDFWIWVFGTAPFDAIYLRWIMLIVGDIITAIGVACYFRTYLPLQVYELVVAEVADRYRLRVNKTKLVFDSICLAVSLILAFAIFRDAATFDWSKITHTAFHSIGLGTVVTTVINAPLITFSGFALDKLFGYEPLLPKLSRLLGRQAKGQATADINE